MMINRFNDFSEEFKEALINEFNRLAINEYVKTKAENERLRELSSYRLNVIKNLQKQLKDYKNRDMKLLEGI